MALQPLVGCEEVGDHRLIGLGDAREVAAELWHQRRELVAQRLLVDGHDPTLAYYDLTVDDHRLDPPPSFAEDELARHAVQGLVGDIVEIDDDEIGLHAGADGADLALESHGARAAERCGPDRVASMH